MAVPPSVRGATALIAALPLAAVSLAVVEYTREPTLGLAGLFVLLESAFPAFVLPSLGLVALAGTTLLRARRGAAALVASLLVGACVAASLGDGPGFRFHPATLALGGLVAGLCGLAAHSLRCAWPKRGVQVRSAALVLVLAGGALSRLHYRVLTGHYPNVHAAALVLGFVVIALGVALGARDRAWLGGSGTVAGLLLLVGLVLAPADSSARARAMSRTELARGAGVARALSRERDDLLPTELLRREVTPDPEGAAVFAEHSGLPALPVEFDLSEHDVLLVLIDAARHDRAMEHMPVLAGFARRSLSFDRAMSPSNGTFPSVASMMAMAPVSRAELDIRPRFWRGRLRPERETAAEAMRSAGRDTFWVGHDHRGCFRDNIRGLEQGFEDVERVFQAHGEADADVDEDIASRAIARLQQRGRGARFFGLVFFVSPHDDYQAHGSHATDELARYDAELNFVDRQLERLIAATPEGTVIIVAGDHGEAFGEHGHHHHLSSVHREQVHVPLVVHVPGMDPVTLSEPTSTMYVLPWLLARGASAEREAARRAFQQDLGPWIRGLDGAVASEMIGPRAQGVSLATTDHDVVYDVFADLARIYDHRDDPEQRRDLRESDPALLARFAPLTRRYRALRFAGQRFRFVGARP